MDTPMKRNIGVIGTIGHKGYEEADERLLNHIIESKKSHREIREEKDREYVLQRNRRREEFEKYIQDHRMEQYRIKCHFDNLKAPKPRWIHR